MEAYQVWFLIIVMLLEVSATAVLLRRMARLARRLEGLRLVCDGRFGALERVVRELEGENDTAPETRADDRKKAREAERRFTEGVENILSFSCDAVGRKSEV